MKKGTQFFLSLLSFAIVALGQPSASPVLSLLASAMGFSLFWITLFPVQCRKKRFLYSALWFTAVQSVQLSWMATPEYQGAYIFFVYAGLIVWLGLQFGFLSLFFPKNLPLSLSRILLISSAWTLIEWGRLFIFCGFAWNPIGLSMTAHTIPAQLVSVWGVFGLSFWVMVVNLLALNLFFAPQKKAWFLWGGCFALPYLFGISHIAYHDWQKELGSQKLDVALVQTALLPDQKTFFYDKRDRFVPAFHQWSYMIRHLEQKRGEDIDLIVFPESAAPFSASTCVYPYESVIEVLQHEWHQEGLAYSDLLHAPYAEKRKGKWYVSNHFWSQALANHYGAEVIIGLDDTNEQEGVHYAAAFHFLPQDLKTQRYEKRILVPLAEYLPLKFLQPLVARYGIADFFTHGQEAKVFTGHCPISISICYEECFGHLMREGRKKGAELFVNVTNDGWYPASRLSKQHFDHGRLRALENGVPLVRACNTGVTAGVDSLGRTIAQLDDETHREALVLPVKLYSYATFYTFWGDYGIISLCILFFIWGITRRQNDSENNV